MRTFKVALPGEDINSTIPDDFAVNSLYPSPKIDSLADPPHFGTINLNWRTSGISVPFGTTKLLYSFKHNYKKIPSCFASYKEGIDGGTLPYAISTLGIIVIDSDINNVNIKYFSIDIFDTSPIPPFAISIKFYVMAEPGYL